MVLYWGARSLRDLYLPDLPGTWQAAHRNFTFIPVLSDPQPADAWPGRTGLVHQAVLADFPDLSGYQVYACGAPAMIDAARRDFARPRAARATSSTRTASRTPRRPRRGPRARPAIAPRPLLPGGERPRLQCRDGTRR